MPWSKREAKGGTSLNFVPAGTVIAVRAHPEDAPPAEAQARAHDPLWEHHLYRYHHLANNWPQ